MDLLLSLLIPSLTSRSHLLLELKAEIARQQGERKDIEVLTNIDNGQKPVGEKRNELLLAARGHYVAFIDDDDQIDGRYLETILQALSSRPDCVGFEGYITINGNGRKNFKMSREFDYRDGGSCYYRPINHLCPVKREIALKIMYPNIDCGEDYDYCMRLKMSGLLKTERYIAEELYHYRFDTGLTATQRR